MSTISRTSGVPEIPTGVADAPHDPPPAHDAGPSSLLPPGTVLDERYELAGRIADGGAGTVYEARDRLLQRTVAVKVRRDCDLDQGERFEQEARLMAGLSHPGLVTVFDAGTDTRASDAPQAYLVMELVPGRTLRHGSRAVRWAATTAPGWVRSSRRPCHTYTVAASSIAT